MQNTDLLSLFVHWIYNKVITINYCCIIVIFYNKISVQQPTNYLPPPKKRPWFSEYYAKHRSTLSLFVHWIYNKVITIYIYILQQNIRKTSNKLPPPPFKKLAMAQLRHLEIEIDTTACVDAQR